MGGKTLPCGLEVKTIHYLKKYFGTARCLEEGGSITIFGSLNVETGNPMDDIIARELSELATLKIELSEELALRRVYPAIQFEKSQGKYNKEIKPNEDFETEILVRNKVLPNIGSEGLLTLLNDSDTKKEFEEKIKTF
jgi:transcription termination factor Rho